MPDAKELLQSLVAKPLATVSGRPNRIVDVRGDEVLVATNRSPKGQPVPISMVQAAVDQLYERSEIEISVNSVGHRSAFIGAVLLAIPGAQLVDGASPPRIRLRS